MSSLWVVGATPSSEADPTFQDAVLGVGYLLSPSPVVCDEKQTCRRDVEPSHGEESRRQGKALGLILLLDATILAALRPPPAGLPSLLVHVVLYPRPKQVENRLLAGLVTRTHVSLGFVQHEVKLSEGLPCSSARRGRRGRGRRSEERNPIQLDLVPPPSHSRLRLHHDLPVHGHPAREHDVLGLPPRRHAGKSKSLAQPHGLLASILRRAASSPPAFSLGPRSPRRAKRRQTSSTTMVLVMVMMMMMMVIQVAMPPSVVVR
mmetsp:Transcript_6255/g.18601  ORF Transcript_6255/g.18601 Transcript_6255/m.18601 type:complete len:262 (+) Transcript_6255:1604-2389(+)